MPPGRPDSRGVAPEFSAWIAPHAPRVSGAALPRPHAPSARAVRAARPRRRAAVARFVRLVRIFSGIQPTGRKHLGNYIGAIRQYVEGQDRGDPAIYCIVDLHAITVPYDPAELRERLYDTTAILLAAGLDPDRCILFRQSDVKEHTELCWLLSSVTAIGELNRMHQFRDKSLAQRELVSAGLLFYPVLQAADVLAYRAHEVPVGEDQREHLELMRDVARRFNARFGEDVLVVPEHRIPEVGARIMDLQEPTRKMSTTGGTEDGTVLVLDDPKTIERKVKRAVTDSGSDIVRSPDKPGVSNLIDVLAVARGVSPEAVEEDMRSARGYGDLKGAVAEAVVDMLAPVRARYDEIRPDQDRLEAILAQGADKARAIASDTLGDVREVMGVGAPRR
jgi:tryptophanyl-tRNA synthetase